MKRKKHCWKQCSDLSYTDVPTTKYGPVQNIILNILLAIFLEVLFVKVVRTLFLGNREI